MSTRYPPHPDIKSDHLISVIGIIRITKPITIELHPFGVLRWVPSLEKQDCSPKEIYRDIITYRMNAISRRTERHVRQELTDAFWESKLSALIGQQPRPRYVIDMLKRRIRNTFNVRGAELLPEGMEALVGFDVMLNAEELFSDIIPDMIIALKAMTPGWTRIRCLPPPKA
jgi:hypothetical protein